MGDNNSDGYGGGVDGDGSGGNSPSGKVPEQSFCPPKLVFDVGGAMEPFVEDDRLF